MAEARKALGPGGSKTSKIERQRQITSGNLQEWRDQVKERLKEAMRRCRLSLLYLFLNFRSEGNLIFFNRGQVAMWST